MVLPGKMSDSRTSLFTAAGGDGYGALPDSAPRLKKEKGTSSRSRVVASVAGAGAVLGALAMVASGQTPFYAAPLGVEETRAITFAEVLATKGHSFASLKKARVESIELLSRMTVGNAARINTPNTKARLGSSEYRKCVGNGAKPSGEYVVSDEKEWRNDLVFVENRESFPAVTSYNDSKALLMNIACEVPPPNIFGETTLCTDKATAGFCNSDCGMPAPRNCDPGARDFGSCEPTVRTLCGSIETSRMTCKQMKDQVVDKVDHYDAITVGALPCRTEPDAPFAKAAYAQMKYESSYLDWANALNDATEVCTIGHALYVQKLGLFESHYAVVVSTTNDLKKMCAEEGKYFPFTTFRRLLAHTRLTFLFYNQARSTAKFPLTPTETPPARSSRLHALTCPKLLKTRKKGSTSPASTTTWGVSWFGGTSSASPRLTPWRASLAPWRLKPPSSCASRKRASTRRNGKTSPSTPW